ncbi:MAG: anthranilate synthase component I family protein [Methylacidiphilales bacterium]|nr:anthranilate synthase component I family protein [Candidatus Methylacidiphilales bacterium]MDW8350107.1 anthranilate synthase component I family protein [Verrucomicrobiae bacterium]
MSCFISINSWNYPGVIYQAEDSFLSIKGHLSTDKHELKEAFSLVRNSAHPDSPHPQGGAVGYVTFEGNYRFEFFKKFQVHEEWPESPLWRSRKHIARSSESSYYAPRSNLNPYIYTCLVEKAKDYIASGDIYQVNLAHIFSTSAVAFPYLLFEELMKISPAPGAAFLDFEDEIILSASPELYFKINGNLITTQPIKGTRPRDLADPVRDQQHAYELLTSSKEIAELIMITDLMRNDLGKICKTGSVITPELISLKSYSHVHHLVSTIEGELMDDLSPVDILQAIHPGGSISGAPKKRAIEIIQELEPIPRKHYTGGIGYFAFNGDAAWSMAIRTLIQKDGQLSFGVGSGITADSNPQAEFDETMHKAAGILAAIETYHKKYASYSISRY